jgi:hypothetical protein
MLLLTVLALVMRYRACGHLFKILMGSLGPLFLKSRHTAPRSTAGWVIVSGFGQSDSGRHQQIVGDGAACDKTSIGSHLSMCCLMKEQFSLTPSQFFVEVYTEFRFF